jgi:HSP20 family protein
MLLTKRPGTQLATRDELDRLFDRFLGGFPFALPEAPAIETLWSPNLDFSETEKEYVVRLEVPGIPKEDLEVNLDGRVLTLTGRREFQKEEKGEEFFWRERQFGKFVRTMQLPAPVDPTKVQAIYAEGIMTVRMPKLETSAKTRIAIK